MIARLGRQSGIEEGMQTDVTWPERIDRVALWKKESAPVRSTIPCDDLVDDCEESCDNDSSNVGPT